MYINILPFIHFTAFVIYLFLAFYILQKNYKALLNRYFFILFSCFSIWSFGFIFVHNHNTSKDTAAFFMSVASFGWIWLSVLFLWFAFRQTRTKIKNWILIVFTIIPSLIFSIFQWSGALIIEYEKAYYGWSLVFCNNWIFWSWIFYYLFLGLVIFALLLNQIIKEKQGTYRTQTIIILIFSIVTLTTGTLIDVVLPFLDIRVIPDVANLIALLWVLGVGYAMMKYKIFIITPITASENILFTMSDMFVTLNFKGDIVNINKSTEKILGYKNNEVKKKPGSILFKNNKDFFEMINMSHQGDELVNKKIYFKTKDDKRDIPVMLNSSTIKNKDNNYIGIVCIARDISNLEATEAILQRQSRELQDKIYKLKDNKIKLFNLLEELNNEKNNTESVRRKTKLVISSLTDPIIFINNENKIDLVNPAAQMILNLKDNVIGSIVLENDNYSIKHLRKIINTDFDFNKDNKKQSEYEEIKLRYLDQDRIFKVLTSEVKNEFDYKLGTLKIFYDFTRERSLENMKSEFISIASHKLRTPLSAIKWVIKMALDGDVGDLSKEQFDLLDKAYKSNERIIELVNNLLNVSKIEEGRFNYNFKEINFKEIIGVIDDYAQTLAEKNKIKFSVNYDGDLPNVKIDQDRIILVLQNLVDNAMKYTPSSGKIEVNIKNTKKFLHVSVVDNGVGIPNEDQKKLFTKFFRAKNVIRMQTEGSGLGLFIVKNIIEKHNGKINIKSKEGIGTEISFSLPLSI